MPEPDELLLVVWQWVQKAESDLQTATYMLRLGEGCPTEIVCFHAQECIETDPMALLVVHETEFPWTHNLGLLISGLPRTVRPYLSPEEQELLTDYATTIRYPGDYEPISLAEAKLSVRLARRVRREIRRHLPRQATRRSPMRRE